MSYESPINITEIATQIAENFDVKAQTYIIKTMANYGINVSPGELMRALVYDRNQYEIGYKEGYREAIEDVRAKLKEIDVEFNYLDSLLSEI